MIEIYNWCVANWGDILAIYAGIVTVASIIVKLTPTIADDTALKSVIRFVGRYIALNR
jgi:hypothetical protein